VRDRRSTPSSQRTCEAVQSAAAACAIWSAFKCFAGPWPQPEASADRLTALLPIDLARPPVPASQCFSQGTVRRGTRRNAALIVSASLARPPGGGLQTGSKTPKLISALAAFSVGGGRRPAAAKQSKKRPAGAGREAEGQWGGKERTF
jgi:hypothetical protein